MTADARDFHRGKVVVGPRAEWSAVFEGNPRILKKPEPGCEVVDNYTGHRPYIKEIRDRRTVFSDYKARPGEIFLTFREKHWAGRVCPPDFILVEPHTKGTVYADNKQWPFERYQEVVRSVKATWVQVGPKKTLKGVKFIHTPTFRDACAILDRAKLFLGGEGGLHHAAAALGKKAVVIFGGCANPKVTGYDTHINLSYGEPCGSLYSCPHCKDAMAHIKVGGVVEAIYEESR